MRLTDPTQLAAAEEAGLIEVSSDGRVAFSHPLYASAVYASAPLARRRAAHRALAETASDPEERARHVALAADGPDELAAAVVDSASRLARSRGAPDAAAELNELALQLTPPESPALQERRLELATNLELAGDLGRATALLGISRRQRPTRTCARERCSCSRISSTGEQVSRRQAWLRAKRSQPLATRF